MANDKNTHVATTPNKREPTPIEVLRKEMTSNENYINSVQNYFAGSRTEMLRFNTAAIDYIRAVPKLLECTPVSLLSAFVKVAMFRFMPTGSGGEAYVIPYAKEAKFQLGYQGIVTLLYRTNKIIGITSNIIYKNDKFEYEEGLDARLKHIPAMFGTERGEAIGVYTIAEMKGGSKTFKVMDKAGIMGIKALSKAKGSQDSPWNSDKDPEMWMWKKTCLIQHAKLLPKTAELVQAIALDNEGGGIDKGHFDADGPATQRASHAPIKVDSTVMEGEDLVPEFVPDEDRDDNAK